MMDSLFLFWNGCVYVFEVQVHGILMGGKFVGDMAWDATKVQALLAKIPKVGMKLLLGCIIVVTWGLVWVGIDAMVVGGGIWVPPWYWSLL